MSESTPPPSGPPPGTAAEAAPAAPAEPAPARVFKLATPTGIKRLLGGSRGVHEISVAPAEILVEHTGSLRAPLRFAPGSIAVAVIDPGPGAASKNTGRFAILRRLSKTAVIPRSEGIEG